MIRYERAAFPGVDASQRAWIEELTQAANRAAHAMTITDREADRAFDTMLLLAESLGLDPVVASLVELRLDAPGGPTASATPAAVVEDGPAEAEADPDAPSANGGSADQRTATPATPDEPDVDDLPPGLRAVSVRAGDVVALSAEVSRRLAAPTPFRPEQGGLIAPYAASPAPVAAVAPTRRVEVVGARLTYRPAAENFIHAAGHLDSPNAQSRALIRGEIERAIAAEAPILVDRLVQVVAHRFGLSRVHERHSQQLQSEVLEHNVRRSENGDRVVWAAGADPQAYTGFRVPAAGAQRPLTSVPYEELRNAMVQVANDDHGADREAILRETARLFGTARLASVARPRLETALTAAVRERRLVLRDGTITAPEPRT
jgi:hypothetical protein